jgi:hypothetical protein
MKPSQWGQIRPSFLYDRRAHGDTKLVYLRKQLA